MASQVARKWSRSCTPCMTSGFERFDSLGYSIPRGSFSGQAGGFYRSRAGCSRPPPANQARVNSRLIQRQRSEYALSSDGSAHRQCKWSGKSTTARTSSGRRMKHRLITLPRSRRALPAANSGIRRSVTTVKNYCEEIRSTRHKVTPIVGHASMLIEPATPRQHAGGHGLVAWHKQVNRMSCTGCMTYLATWLEKAGRLVTARRKRFVRLFLSRVPRTLEPALTGRIAVRGPACRDSSPEPRQTAHRVGQ